MNLEKLRHLNICFLLSLGLIGFVIAGCESAQTTDAGSKRQQKSTQAESGKEIGSEESEGEENNSSTSGFEAEGGAGSGLDESILLAFGGLEIAELPETLSNTELAVEWTLENPEAYRLVTAKLCTSDQCELGCTDSVQQPKSPVLFNELERGRTYFACFQGILFTDQKTPWIASTRATKVLDLSLSSVSIQTAKPGVPMPPVKVTSPQSGSEQVNAEYSCRFKELNPFRDAKTEGTCAELPGKAGFEPESGQFLFTPADYLNQDHRFEITVNAMLADGTNADSVFVVWVRQGFQEAALKLDLDAKYLLDSGIAAMEDPAWLNLSPDEDYSAQIVGEGHNLFHVSGDANNQWQLRLQGGKGALRLDTPLKATDSFQLASWLQFSDVSNGDVPVLTAKAGGVEYLSLHQSTSNPGHLEMRSSLGYLEYAELLDPAAHFKFEVTGKNFADEKGKHTATSTKKTIRS